LDRAIAKGTFVDPNLVFAQKKDGTVPSKEDTAIRGGLGWLAHQQLPNGSWFFEGIDKDSAPPVVGVIFPDDENDDAWVTEVAVGSPAEKAGLKSGDTITKLDSTAIKSVKQFREIIKDRKPGDVVRLTVRRANKSVALSVTLGKRAE
jgi:S1-C subfamily serine protease